MLFGWAANRIWLLTGSSSSLLQECSIHGTPARIEFLRHWVLVTSASHMPRAIGCFREAGIHIEPWPIADISTGWRDT
jgi:hypothetical protein